MLAVLTNSFISEDLLIDTCHVSSEIDLSTVMKLLWVHLLHGKNISDELAGHGKKIFQMSMQVTENANLGNSNKTEINQLNEKIDQVEKLINSKQQERLIPETQMNVDQTTRSRESVEESTGNADTLQGEIFTSITLAL